MFDWLDFSETFKAVSDAVSSGYDVVSTAVDEIGSEVLGLGKGVFDSIFGEQVFSDPMKMTSDDGTNATLPAVASRKGGLIEDVVGFTRKNPEATKLIGQIGLGVASGYQKEKDREFQQNLYNQKVEADRQLLKDRYDLDAKAAAEKRRNMAENFNFKVN